MDTNPVVVNDNLNTVSTTIKLVQGVAFPAIVQIVEEVWIAFNVNIVSETVFFPVSKTV